MHQLKSASRASNDWPFGQWSQHPKHLLGIPLFNHSNIYSLAAIAYEMLTEHLPYGAGITSAAAIRKEHYVSAGTLRKDVPNLMDAAFEDALRIKPAERTDALLAFTTNLRKSNTALSPTCLVGTKSSAILESPFRIAVCATYCIHLSCKQVIL